MFLLGEETALKRDEAKFRVSWIRSGLDYPRLNANVLLVWDNTLVIESECIILLVVTDTTTSKAPPLAKL